MTEQLVTVFAALTKRIRGLLALEHGENNRQEGKSGSFTHCVMMTFDPVMVRDGYLPYPSMLL